MTAGIAPVVADTLIEKGLVTINGKLAQLGDRVLPDDVIKIDGKTITNDVREVYIAFNKPVGIVCTGDSRERTT